MRTFEQFPEISTCIICGNNDNKECTLIPIDDTKDGNIIEATPVHVDCVRNLTVRYNRYANIVYQVINESKTKEQDSQA